MRAAAAIAAQAGATSRLMRTRPLVAVTLGGGELTDVGAAARLIAPVASENDVVVTYGTGPQVGLLARQGALDRALVPYPLDVLDAESEGMTGYLLEQELRALLPGREVATLLTQVAVDSRDPAFGAPSRPVGPIYSRRDARRLAHEWGWSVIEDGPYFRRVVASPRPLAIVELSAIRLLLERGVAVICAGGGGIPVIDQGGRLRGVEAVVDDDLSAELLARLLHADRLLHAREGRLVEMSIRTEGDA